MPSRGARQEPQVAVYLPNARGFVGDFDEKGVKLAIQKVGGNPKESGLFLPDVPSCRATTVNSKTSVNRNSVMLIPRSAVSSVLLKQLDQLCTEVFSIFVESMQTSLNDHLDSEEEEQGNEEEEKDSDEDDSEEEEQGKEEEEKDSDEDDSEEEEDEKDSDEDDGEEEEQGKEEEEKDSDSDDSEEEEQGKEEEEKDSDEDDSEEEEQGKEEEEKDSGEDDSTLVSPIVGICPVPVVEDGTCAHNEYRIKKSKAKTIKWMCKVCHKWYHIFCVRR